MYDFAYHDLYAKPYGLLRLSTWLKSQGHTVFFADALDVHNTMYSYEPGTIVPRRSPNGAGHHFKKRAMLPAILADAQREWYLFGLSVERLIESVPDIDFDWICVAIPFTYHYLVLGDLLSALRTRWPKSTTVLGGLYPILCPEHAKRQGFDITATSGFTSLEASPVFSGISDCTALPDWEQYPVLSYGVVRATTGCPYRCPYCASGHIAPRYGREPEDALLGHLDYFSERKVKSVAFYDDAFLAEPERAKLLLRRIAQKRYQFTLSLPNAIHIAGVDREMALLLAQCRFTMIRFGFESVRMGSDSVYGGKYAPEDFERLCGFIRERILSPDWCRFYVLMGLPGQEVEEVVQSVEFLLARGLRPSLTEFSPVPGTELFAGLSSTFPPLDLSEPLYQNPNYYSYHATPFTHEKVKEIRKLISEYGIPSHP